MKRIVAILLCIALVMSMAACSQTDSASETQSPADSYLKMAQELVAQEKYDSAIDILNQAKVETEDPRLDAMIAEIEASRPIILDVDYSANSDKLKTKGLQIHGVTAQVLGEIIRYEVDYTAPEGMYLQVLGTDLARCRDYLTPGGKSLFTFELDKQTGYDYFKKLTVLFKYNTQDYLQLDIITTWPEAAPETLVEIPVTNGSNEACHINRATVRAVNEDLLHFHVEYTTPLDQQYLVALCLGSEEQDIFYSVGVAPGKDMVSFVVDRARMETVNVVTVRLWPQNKWDNALIAELRSSDYTLPQAPASGDAKEVLINNTECPVETMEGKHLTLDSVLIQQTAAGNLYTLKGDFSETAVNTAYCEITGLAYTSTTLTTNPKELQLFIPNEILSDAMGLYIEFWGQNDYIAWAPLPYDHIGIPVTVLQPETSYAGLSDADKLAQHLADSASRVFAAAQIDTEAAKAVDTSVIQPLTEGGQRYLYAVMNTKSMSEEDLAAARAFLSTYTDVTVLEVECVGIRNAQELYTILQADSIQRGGEVVGVQILGTSDLVPTFTVTHKVRMPDGMSSGNVLTDLFYGDFSNNASDLTKSYNVVDHFDNKLPVQLLPQWPVVRLPLTRGQFAPYFEKYNEFRNTHGTDRLDLVCFDNPFFASYDHVDDFGIFLKRMDEEFDLLDIEYRIYGNLDGDYPVQIEVEGDTNWDTLEAENMRGPSEFLITSGGRSSYLVKVYMENGRWLSGELVHMNTEKDTMGHNLYYMDQWGCEIGADMKNNLVCAALNGNCVGAFAHTGMLANTNINCNASLEQMSQGNMFYFFFHYLKAMNEGAARGEAFFRAQQAFCNSLVAESQEGRSYESIYQFNLYNLLAYHNFGVLEPESIS